MSISEIPSLAIKALFVSFFLLSTSLLQAQKLTGKITNENNSPLIEAYIYNPSGTIHSHSDIQGNFIINGLTPGDTMMVSYLGYETYKLTLNEENFQSPLLVSLKNSPINLNQIYVNNSLKQAYKVSDIDLQLAPVTSSQEVLQKVPGLFIGQHAGGGKAEQIFLRGFDIDHGTDIALSVDGMPVNMVSHAHGQGYADLHFVIPETIDKINFGKGPYYTNHGNFNTAGYVDFKTKDRLDNSAVSVEYGMFNHNRLMGMFDLLGNNADHSAYVATEYILTDGPFESPQNFNRFNTMIKYSGKIDETNQISVLASTFSSKWDASGQIPQRLVNNGTITRFGAVDDTEGGETSRTNLAVKHTKLINSNLFNIINAYYSKYDFELFSNFTFFLDFDDGDQIRQHESRQLYGFTNTLHHTAILSGHQLQSSFGVGFRADDIDDNTLAYTINRKETREELANGNVDETNLFAFANAEYELGNFMVNAGLRLDAFTFNYVDQLATTYERQTAQNAIVSPKLNLIYNPNNKLQVYVKSGLGFHSNDSRVSVVGDLPTLPTALGVDLGAVYKLTPRILVNGALWYLDLEQEFVYVGDAAIVEPSGQTRRRGFEGGVRVQLTNELFFDSDVSYTIARSLEDPEGSNYIPLAPSLTAAGGISYQKVGNGLQGSLRYRYIKDRPANEDFSIIAEGYFVVDANLSYQIGSATIGLVVQNLLDTEWNEAQFATESQLQNETESVEELHFTPGVPLNLRGRVTYNF